MMIWRYCQKQIFLSVGMIMLLLIGLHVSLSFLGELNRIGRGNYGFLAAVSYVMLGVPGAVFDYLPVAAFMGTLLGLGLLASHGECLVMRVSGCSLMRLTLGVILAGVVMGTSVFVLSEWVVPKSLHLAQTQKTTALSGGQAVKTHQGIWVKNQNDMVTIRHVLDDTHLQGVTDFHFEKQKSGPKRLVRVTYGEKAFFEKGNWWLSQVTENQLGKTQVKLKTVPLQKWQFSLQPGILTVAKDKPEELSMESLFKTLRYQSRQGLEDDTTMMVLIQRVMQPFSVIAMMLLAVPFVFGPLRSASTGFRLVIGILLGFGFLVGNELVMQASLVYELPPWAVMWIPTALLGAIATAALYRIR